MNSTVTCLCATYGRVADVRRALRCFLDQDTERCELLLWNFHQVPLRLAEDYPRVRLVNEPHPGHSTEIWMRGLAMVDTEFVRAWLDDDLYLPWACRQGLERIGDAPAFMERRRLVLTHHLDFSYNEDPHDGAGLTLRTEAARRYGMDDYPLVIVPPGTALEDRLPSWVLRWWDDDHTQHRRSHLLPRAWTPQEKNAAWRARQTDPGDGRTALAPGEVDRYWVQLCREKPEYVEAMIPHFKKRKAIR